MSEFEKVLSDMRAQREIFRKQSKEAKEVFYCVILLGKVSLLTAWIEELESAIVRSTLVALKEAKYGHEN